MTKTFLTTADMAVIRNIIAAPIFVRLLKVPVTIVDLVTAEAVECYRYIVTSSGVVDCYSFEALAGACFTF